MASGMNERPSKTEMKFFQFFRLTQEHPSPLHMTLGRRLEDAARIAMMTMVHVTVASAAAVSAYRFSLQVDREKKAETHQAGT
ncbi:hypothetical protein PAXINDRAFT_170580 [Paxillus involutus ATCC 200175]|jgi:site-specific recombinase|uniref:Uncharacterized protein n=1 Tax=Paxillus involutus ATCC 200175 TaxID=664439 RepID=A0A0C9TCJ4_PAXIN|nr:hypothetical protein PAXINDRAFT_170580 [Paxillus involutus ATCC 200175]